MKDFTLPTAWHGRPIRRRLYFADSVARTIYAYGYDAATGSVRDRRVLAQLDGSSGLPDGLTVDAEGFIWFAEWYGGCVCRYDPDGTLERRIAVPAKQTSSLAFGGPDLRDIFITSAATSEPTPVMPPGYDRDQWLLRGRSLPRQLRDPGTAGVSDPPAPTETTSVLMS